MERLESGAQADVKAAKNFRIYGLPLLSIVAALTIVPSLLNTFVDVPLDFTVFMMSARAFRRGLDPYREVLALHAPNANPPAFLLATLPLTVVPERIAFALWTAGSLVALIFSLEQMARALKLPSNYLLLVAACIQGVATTLRFGQVTLLLLPMMTLAWVADREQRPVAAGAWLGALMYVKPFFGVYGLYLLWRREWRALRTAVMAFGLLFAFGLLAGIGVTASWVETLRSITEKTSHVVNASWPALVSRVFLPDRSQPDPAYTAWMVAPHLATVLSLGGAAAIGLISAWAVARSTNRDMQWAVLSTAMLLISPLGWMYYTPFLMPPLAAVIPRSRHLAAILAAAALLWVPSSILARNHFGPLATATIASPYSWGMLMLWATLSWNAVISRQSSVVGR